MRFFFPSLLFLVTRSYDNWKPPTLVFSIQAGSMNSKEALAISSAIEIAHELPIDESIKIYSHVLKLQQDRLTLFIMEYLFKRIDNENVFAHLLAGTRLDGLASSYFALDDARKKNLCKVVAEYLIASWNLVPRVVAIDKALVELDWLVI